MASTLIKRICDPDQMTAEEISAVILERGYADESQLKLGLHPIVSVASEIIAGRMPEAAMLTWLTADEYIDAGLMLDLITDGGFTLDEIRNLFYLGEFGIYTAAQIETILGL